MHWPYMERILGVQSVTTCYVVKWVRPANQKSRSLEIRVARSNVINERRGQGKICIYPWEMPAGNWPPSCRTANTPKENERVEWE